MAKKAKAAKKKTTKKTGDALTEETTFQSDEATDPYDKNRILAKYLDGIWAELNIVRIERIEIAKKGWQAHYRK